MTYTSPPFRPMAEAAVDRLCRYFESLPSRRVLAPTVPGEVLRSLPGEAPEAGEAWDAIERDLDLLVEPNLTHWQHPGYLAYFATTGSAPAVVGDFLAAGYNQVGILWRASPILTELEQGMVRWLTRLVGLPDSFDGQLADTASASSLIALAAAREEAFPDVRKDGLSGRPPGVVYCSELAHSSIDKACVVLGFGISNLRKIPVDGDFRMNVSLLEEAISRDRAEGRVPVAVVATAGITSVTSVDPLPEIASLCERERIWLHVDAAYAGSAASCPEFRGLFLGWERADSIVFNPHKWMFVPLECSGLFFRRMERVRKALSVVPNYLETPEGAGGVREYMDYGIQLGRRFRSLKLWLTLRTFGAEGVRARIRAAVDLAQRFREVLSTEPGISVEAPSPFSVVVFRWSSPGLSPGEADAANRRILDRINSDGRTFISHTVLRGRHCLRVAIGNDQTTWSSLEAFLDALRDAIRLEGTATPILGPDSP